MLVFCLVSFLFEYLIESIKQCHCNKTPNVYVLCTAVSNSCYLIWKQFIRLNFQARVTRYSVTRVPM